MTSEQIDSKYLEKYQDSRLDAQLSRNTQNTDDNTNDSEYDSDDILQELEDELDQQEDQFLKQYREERMNQLSKEMKQAKKSIKENFNNTDSGIKIIEDEGELMKLTTLNPFTVVLFKNEQFTTCKIMQQILTKLAFKHVNTRFYGIEAVNAPFLAVKMGIKVLPCLVLYKNGVEKDRVVGFERISNKGEALSADNEEIIGRLENILDRSGVITRKAFQFNNLKSITKKPNSRVDEDDDDSDLDM